MGARHVTGQLQGQTSWRGRWSPGGAVRTLRHISAVGVMQRPRYGAAAGWAGAGETDALMLEAEDSSESPYSRGEWWRAVEVGGWSLFDPPLLKPY